MDTEMALTLVWFVLVGLAIGGLLGMVFMNRIQKPVDAATEEYIDALRSQVLSLKELLAHHYLKRED
jgi:hypothetical protein